MRVASTVVVGSIGLIALVAMIVGDSLIEDQAAVYQRAAVRVSAFRGNRAAIQSRVTKSG